MLDRSSAKTKTYSKKPSAETSGPFSLPPLPYEDTALAPAISARTLKFHYGKHHRGYVDKLNKLVKETPYEDMTLEDVVKATAGKTSKAEIDIYHNAAQAWNHAFYWNSLSPKRSQPSAALKSAIARDFGDLDALKEKLSKVATDHFASGWAWLVVKGGKLAVLETGDADTPMAAGVRCLLTVDVWEHAYYLDRQNERKAYVEAVMEGLLNWKFASANFET